MKKVTYRYLFYYLLLPHSAVQYLSRKGGFTLGYWLTPADAGSRFRSLTRAISPTNRLYRIKRGAGSRTVLIMQLVVKSLGHMWCLW